MSWFRRARFTAPFQARSLAVVFALSTMTGAAFAQNLILNGPQNADQPRNEEADKLLAAARTRVLDSMKRAPRYTCTETINRDTWDSKRETHSCETRATADKLFSQDRLRLDVAVSGGGEIFSWHGEKQFAEGDIGDLVGYGMIGSGLFSSFLAGIFGDSTYLNRFHYVQTSAAEGEELAAFTFIMPAAASHWLMRTGARHSIVPYHGTAWIEPETATLKRLHIVADEIPASLQTCSVEVDLRYHIIQLGSNEFVIPERAETVSSGPTGLKSVSQTKFLQCHEFLGESTLHFDSVEDAGAPAQPATVSEIKELPAGLHFTVDLETGLDLKESWVGDPIVGKLRANLKVGNDVIAPKGSRVTGRLVDLQTYMRPEERLEVGFDWQEIDVMPATILKLKAEFTDIGRDVTFSSTPRGPGRRGQNPPSLMTQPVPVEGKAMAFSLGGSRKSVPKYLATTWVTVSLRKEIKVQKEIKADPPAALR